jgi:hypothetical protein
MFAIPEGICSYFVLILRESQHLGLPLQTVPELSTFMVQSRPLQLC